MPKENLKSLFGRVVKEYLNEFTTDNSVLFNSVIARNNGFSTMKEIATIFDKGKATRRDEFIDSLSPKELSCFQYAPQSPHIMLKDRFLSTNKF